MTHPILTKLKEKPNKKEREVVIVYPFNTKTKKMYIIEEYIHSYDRTFWKFVSGGIDKIDKDILAHATEEMAEEIGMESDHVYHLYSSEKIFGNRGMHYFVAENSAMMVDPPANPDEDYITDAKWVNQQEFQTMLDDKLLQWDQGTMCALQAFRRYA